MQALIEQSHYGWQTLISLSYLYVRSVTGNCMNWCEGGKEVEKQKVD